MVEEVSEAPFQLVVPLLAITLSDGHQTGK